MPKPYFEASDEPPRYYPATVEDILTEDAADTSWENHVLDLTRPGGTVHFTGVTSVAGSLIDAALAEIFPADNGTEGPNGPSIAA